MTKLKLIIFDIDGTLINSYPAIISSLNYTLRKLNIKKRSAIEIKRAVGWGDKALLAPFVGNKNVDFALEIYRRHHRKSLIEKSRFMPYAKRLLVYLNKKGYKLAVASNRPKKFSHLLLRHMNIKRFFDYILCKDQIKFGKPHPSILKKIMNRLDASSAQTLYVGDMAIDVKTGKRARVKTFAVSTGSSYAWELRKEHPDFISNNLAKLFKIL
ncbi:MAG: HAD family hydrolase [Candidatus Omnitrophica bacterium]|nr:HAD family hydrolase [Candidatus Omnitrophota bacterium]MDD5352980.1 HAD family hydrolase [Candidatus Omnitrophota bacterium]MDD5550579.1 HAD family hydrolase [Candidatus Omnitrophota bacterium]